MSTPEIDPVTAESEAEDADMAGEHTEPTFRDQAAEPASRGSDEEAVGDEGGMTPD